jgi:hypothetical protein
MSDKFVPGMSTEPTSSIGDVKNDVLVLPVNHSLAGTCGTCGGPIITPVMWSGPIGQQAPEYCMYCGKHPKKQIAPTYGPIKEMEN